MRTTLLAGAFVFGLSVTGAMADQKSVSNAYGLCEMFDGTGTLSEPCSVSGWNSSVDVKMDTNGREARKICAFVAEWAKSQGMKFEDDWKIRIYSPFSEDSTIAQCSLR